ncbi:hypothetical protein RESH_02183 [Rhodopirellula europaea SH398]|uniref:Uncharacterized protein n=1 Tax=Rhodopirellula europaea SH398 TaxID=1263868 RepID=M5S6T1_9BACT|nr:hypothetical protein RESH_02183 [Rhodopirellula europaea SH398]
MGTVKNAAGQSSPFRFAFCSLSVDECRLVRIPANHTCLFETHEVN